MSKQDVDIECDIITETDAAILILVDDEEFWIPRSQVKRIECAQYADTVTMTAWIAEQKGIEA